MYFFDLMMTFENISIDHWKYMYSILYGGVGEGGIGKEGRREESF